jgi:ABC-type uncharacterized transport system substrate-binding protein
MNTGIKKGKQTGKLTTKDFIIAGAFATLYAALLVLAVSAAGFIPTVYLAVYDGIGAHTNEKNV